MPAPRVNRFFCRWMAVILTAAKRRPFCASRNKPWTREKRCSTKSPNWPPINCARNWTFSFAQVELQQARLLVERSQNDADAAMATLSTALGYYPNFMNSNSPIRLRKPTTSDADISDIVQTALSRAARTSKPAGRPRGRASASPGLNATRGCRLSRPWALPGAAPCATTDS